MPAASLFELSFSPEWEYPVAHFLDNEHRYTKMHRLLREGLGDLGGCRLLDLGCCRGHFLARFEHYRDIDVQGIELDPEEIARAKQRGIRVSRMNLNVLEDGRLTVRLPFPDASFDAVLAGEIIEHVVDTETFLQEVGRILRPGGGVVLSTPNVLWLKHRLSVLRGRYPECLDYRQRYGEDLGHVRAFSEDTLRLLLEETGFVDLRVVGKRLGPLATLVRLPAPAARALDRLADRMASLSDHLIAFARRPGTDHP